MAGTRPGLSGRVLRGSLWGGATRATTRVVGLVRLGLLAHLLSPREFGLAETGFMAIQFLEAVSNAGTAFALLAHREPSRALYDTAWTIGLLRRAAIAGVLAAAAPVIGAFFRAPEATSLVRALALVPLLDGARNIGLVQLRKEIRFGPEYALSAAGLAGDAVVSLTLAAWTGSAWALVAGRLTDSMVKLALSYRLHPYRPRLAIAPAEARALMRYGRWVFGSTLLGWVVGTVLPTALGRWVGVEALGVYQMARRLTTAPITEIPQALFPVGVAAYAEAQGSALRLRTGYLGALSVVAAVTLPVAGTLVVFTHPLVDAFLAPRWADVAPVGRLLATGALLGALGLVAAAPLLGIGRPELRAWGSAAHALVVAGALGYLARTPTLVGFAAAATLGRGVETAITLWSAGRALRVPALDVARAIGWPVLATVAALVPPGLLLGARPTRTALIVALGSAAVLYGAALLLLLRSGRLPLPPRFTGGARPFRRPATGGAPEGWQPPAGAP